MTYILSIPARINILGNPGDANEGDFATISAAVELRASAIVEDAPQLILEMLPAQGEPPTCRLELPAGLHPLPYDGQLDLLKGAVNRLYAYSPEFRQKYACQGVRITVWSEVPRQSGLGGSSLFILLALAGLRLRYDLDPRIHNDYVLSELTQRVEGKDLGIACGFADRYVPLFGGLAYLDYRGKLYHHDLHQEPYVTYERLDSHLPKNLEQAFPLVAICTGIQHDSGDVHGRMRPRYLEEYDAWIGRGGPPPPMVRFMSAAWETAWRGKIALLQGDLEMFGALMNQNHRLVDEMMMYCGFPDGAGWANRLCIQAALDNGALGAKLTGAGGGGSVFALVQPGEQEKLAKIWEQTASQVGLKEASVYIPRIAKQGLIINVLKERPTPRKSLRGSMDETQDNFQLLENKILSWAQGESGIRAAFILGSRARTERPADESSDLDITILAVDPDFYLKDASWIEHIGHPWLTFIERTGTGPFFERRVLFEGGYDVDFAFVPVQVAQALTEKSYPPDLADIVRRGVRLILDKDGLAAPLIAAAPAPSASPPPSQEEFLNLVHDFWFHAVWTAKKLARGELWTAKACSDNYMKWRLLTMMEWHARAVHGPTYDTWHRGRFLEEWADPRAIRELRDAFSIYDPASLWGGLFATMKLFHWLAVETADRLNFSYPLAGETHAIQLVNEIQQRNT